MLVVLDTNIIISALLSPNGKPAWVLKQVFDGDFTVCCDDRILREYKTVLSRPKFNFPPNAVKELMSFFRNRSLRIDPKPLEIAFTDEADKKFYEVAKYCNAILITGNRKHFPEDPIIKSVHEI